MIAVAPFRYRQRGVLVALPPSVRLAPQSRPIVWTDDPVTTDTPIKAVHVNELRRAVDRQRRLIGLPMAAWTDDPVIAGYTLIRAIHMLELQAAIQEIGSVCGLGQLPPWTAGSPPASGHVIHASDLNDLRGWLQTVGAPLSASRIASGAS